MNKSEIVIGRTYSNGRGKYRMVVGMGRRYVLYPGQEDLDCLCYREVDAKGNTLYLGQMPKSGNQTRKSFARWAKAVVP